MGNSERTENIEHRGVWCFLEWDAEKGKWCGHVDVGKGQKKIVTFENEEFYLAKYVFTVIVDNHT